MTTSEIWIIAGTISVVGSTIAVICGVSPDVMRPFFTLGTVAALVGMITDMKR